MIVDLYSRTKDGRLAFLSSVNIRMTFKTSVERVGIGLGLSKLERCGDTHEAGARFSTALRCLLDSSSSLCKSSLNANR